ncbi:MAG: hypothetical protein B7C24_04365 [Bacteroidetes bacterium 4572_77]|nr:MAG: hypothetical protein B7C24_04365 [Bacteroidetes bacterium 4572_77]
MKLNRQQNPSLQQISNLRLPKMEVLKLDNHIPAWMINTGSQELLKLQFSFPAGSIYQNKALVSFFTLQMLLEGSQNYSAAQTAERLDFLGAFINTRSSKDFAYLEVFCLNKHLKEVLEIVKDILTQALFPVKELNVLKQQHKQAHIIDIGKVQTQARRSFNQEIFGAQNTYGRLASLSDFEKLKAEDLRLFYQKQFAPSNWSLFVSGKIGPKEVASIQEYIGSIPLVNRS